MQKTLPATLTERLQAVARYIEAHAEEPLPLEALAARAALSPGHFQRRFKALFGLSPKQYQDGWRQRRWREALKAGAAVSEAIGDAGYGSPSRVYGDTARGLGMAPTRYRAGGRGETLSYLYRITCAGPLMMAATDAGVCFAEFGTDETQLLTKLRQEFPSAQCQPATPAEGQLQAWLQALDEHLSGTAPAPALPLDLRGTAFQIKVWRFLRTLDHGSRVTYREVAAGIGAPRAIRAAASACAANRIAVLIPCHRVLRGDGGLGGYRWGVDLKRRLLAQEAAAQ